MRWSTLLCLAATAAAAPMMNIDMDKRQSADSGPCLVGFVFGRGSTEPPPLGMLVGPALQAALKLKIPTLRTFPVMYAASISTNISPQRTDGASIAKGQQAFKQAENCKVIIAGGYSQGAAVMHNVIGKLDAPLKSKVVGVALFGSTRNKQDNGHIPNLPEERSKTWCNKNDGVCGGGLTVNAGHLSYNKNQIGEAATWLAARAGVKAAAAVAADAKSRASTGSKSQASTGNKSQASTGNKSQASSGSKSH